MSLKGHIIWSLPVPDCPNSEKWSSALDPRTSRNTNMLSHICISVMQFTLSWKRTCQRHDYLFLCVCVLEIIANLWDICFLKKADSWRNCPKRLLLFNIGALRPRLKNNSYFQRKCSGLSISADGMLILLNTFFSMRCHCCTYFSLPVHCSKLKKVSWCAIVDFSEAPTLKIFFSVFL